MLIRPLPVVAAPLAHAALLHLPSSCPSTPLPPLLPPFCPAPPLPCSSMGTAAQRSMSREVHADVGYAHLSIPRVELVMWPRQLGGRPEHKRHSVVAELEESQEQSSGGGGGADLGVAAACEAAEDASSGGAAGSVAAGPAVPAGSELQQQPLCHQQQQWQQEQWQWQHQQQQWHDLPVRVLAESSSRQQPGGPSMHGRQASLQLLNSHVASISGRWWDAYEARAAGGSAAAARQQR